MISVQKISQYCSDIVLSQLLNPLIGGRRHLECLWLYQKHSILNILEYFFLNYNKLVLKAFQSEVFLITFIKNKAVCKNTVCRKKKQETNVSIQLQLRMEFHRPPLGSILFLCYVHDLPQIIDGSRNHFLTLFPDDSNQKV